MTDQCVTVAHSMTRRRQEINNRVTGRGQSEVLGGMPRSKRQTEGQSPSQGLRPSLARVNEQGPLLVPAGITNNVLMAQKTHRI